MTKQLGWPIWMRSSVTSKWKRWGVKNWRLNKAPPSMIWDQRWASCSRLLNNMASAWILTMKIRDNINFSWSSMRPSRNKREYFSSLSRHQAKSMKPSWPIRKRSLISSNILKLKSSMDTTKKYKFCDQKELKFKIWSKRQEIRVLIRISKEYLRNGKMPTKRSSRSTQMNTKTTWAS